MPMNDSPIPLASDRFCALDDVTLISFLFTTSLMFSIHAMSCHAIRNIHPFIHLHLSTLGALQEALRKKDLELQESLIKFNKFLQENESKRNRAVKRAADEAKQREIKEAEIKKLREQHRLKLEEEEALQKQLRLNEKYQKFLADVVEHGSDEYHEIQDLLNRWVVFKFPPF